MKKEKEIKELMILRTKICGIIDGAIISTMESDDDILRKYKVSLQETLKEIENDINKLEEVE
jgi:hypothetical protein